MLKPIWNRIGKSRDTAGPLERKRFGLVTVLEADLEGAKAPTLALDPKYYTDPAIFEREKDRIFYRTWQYAGHLSRLRNKGDYFTFEVAGQNIFAVRDRQDKVRCFYNVCMHRAHELLSGEGNRKIITCPYHAWSYGLDGQFRRAPNQEKVKGFDGSKVCLTEVRSESFLGFLFVNLDPQAQPMDEWYPGAREELASYVPEMEKLVPIITNAVDEDCNWKVSVENYSECYHCRLVHPTFSSGVIDPECYNIMPQGHCLRHTTRAANLDAMTYPIDESIPHASDYSSWFLWPTISFQVYPGNQLNTYRFEPTGHATTRVHRDWYSPNGVESDVVDRLAQQDLATTVSEDVSLVNSVQRGLKSRGYRPGPLVIDPDFGVKSEHSVQALKEWALEALGE
ncbi:MAG: aromatic ring-hydroxylating dioxygenase subunit alpha [Kiloniellales bacterium]|nr:aromatic ring-hydroxylating dioxygenase subunit alpha [Kiloniellales bacterium]